VDAVAGLRPCEVDVTLAGVVYTVPALPAADWLAAIVGEPGAVLPGLLPLGDQLEIHHRILRGQLEPKEVNQAWRDLLGAACGRSWWSAARLCMSAADAEAWPAVHGRLLTSGVDLEKVSIGALCNAIYFMIMSSSEDESERSKHQFELEMPPPGEEATAFDDREQIADDFMAAIAQLQQFG
jgi:hypothetical protein